MTFVMGTESAAAKSIRVGPPQGNVQPDWLESIRQQVASLQFGVIQIDRTETIRVESKN